MTNQILSPRIEYSFPEYIDIPIIADPNKIADSIKEVLKKEFNVSCELVSSEIVDTSEVVSHGEFVSCIDLLTGDLYHFCLDVEKLSDNKIDFRLVPRKKYFIKAMVFRWTKTREIRNAKFDFY